MSFTICDYEQRSPGWFEARLGRLTGSRAADMLATIKSGEAAARRDLRTQLVLERITGQSQENGYINADMQRGTEKEPDALAAYEALTGNLARGVGFLAHDVLKAGCSPDGEIGGFVGLLELKCPKSATHLGYLKAKTVPKDYHAQMVHALWITGAQWCDFLSFDDRFSPELQTFLVRVKRSGVDIDGYERKALAFLAEVEAEYLAIKTMTKGVAA